MSEMRDYLDKVSELPNDVLLGRVVMFTVADMNPVTHADIQAWFGQLQLNTAYLPAVNRAVDAFKKATRKVDRVEYDRTSSGTKGVLLVRDVSTDDEMIVRHLVREVVDAQRRKLSHDKVAELVFYKAQMHKGKVQPGTERVRLTMEQSVDAEDAIHVRKALTDVQTQYEHEVKYIDSNKLRATIREYLKYLNAIEIKGGVYFIHINRTDELMRLRDLVNRCGAGTRMDQIPILDLDNERQMVIEAFQREAEQALNDLSTEIATVRATRQKVTPSMYAKLRGEYDKVINQALEYQRTLRINQDRTSAAAELALDSLTELQKAFLEAL